MRLISLASHNVRQRWLPNALTSLSILLGVALVSLLWMMAEQARERFDDSAVGYRAIIGPTKTSPTDLVLSTVFYFGQSQGIVPLSVYREVHDGKIAKSLGVRYAIPQAFGDYYRRFPIIGTTDEWFHKFGTKRDKKGKPIPLKMREGRAFRFGHTDLLKEAEFQAKHANDKDDGHEHEHEIPAAWKEVVLGSTVARRLGLELGSEVIPSHSAEGSAFEQHEDARCKVVGILAKTGTPVDKAIYVPLGLVYRIAGHEAIGGEERSADDVEISAIVVDTRHPMGHQKLRHMFQRRKDAQVAIPSVSIPKLFEIVGDIRLYLNVISLLVLLVAAIAVFVSLYGTMFERKRDVAIMRSLGARRRQILGIVLMEAVIISGSGALLGVFTAHQMVWIFGQDVEEKLGVQFSATVFELRELWLILGVCALGGLAGLLPAITASRSDVASNLTPS